MWCVVSATHVMSATQNFKSKRGKIISCDGLLYLQTNPFYMHYKFYLGNCVQEMKLNLVSVVSVTPGIYAGQCTYIKLFSEWWYLPEIFRERNAVCSPQERVRNTIFWQLSNFGVCGRDLAPWLCLTWVCSVSNRLLAVHCNTRLQLIKLCYIICVCLYLTSSV